MAADNPITDAEIRDFLEKYQAAANSEDFSNIRDMIHPDAIFRFTDGDFVGRTAIQDAFEKTWGLDIQDAHYCLTNINVISKDAKSATVTFTFNWTGRVQGRPVLTVGRGTSVIVRNENRLQIILEHLSH
jgi:ketosteroid isomerase-like protein